MKLNPTVDPRDAKRLSKQCEALLALLRQGPRLNTELVHIAMNLTARISEIRQSGWDIKATRKGGGVFEYRLIGKTQAAQLRLAI